MAEIRSIRVLPESRYTILRNEAIRDDRLSYRARGVLAWLLSHQHGHTVSATEIAQAGREGRDAIRATLTELEATGYIARRKLRALDGTFRHVVTVSDKPSKPVEKPVENPVDTQRPGTGFQAPVFQAI